MDYPQTFVAVDGNPGGTVVSWAVIYAPGGSLGAPPGGTVYQIPNDSPVTYGWRYMMDDADQWGWHPPLHPVAETASVVDDDGGDAGNGNPPPPPPKNGG